jgi:hypothetical protein
MTPLNGCGDKIVIRLRLPLIASAIDPNVDAGDATQRSGHTATVTSNQTRMPSPGLGKAGQSSRRGGCLHANWRCECHGGGLFGTGASVRRRKLRCEPCQQSQQGQEQAVCHHEGDRRLSLDCLLRETSSVQTYLTGLIDAEVFKITLRSTGWPLSSR